MLPAGEGGGTLPFHGREIAAKHGGDKLELADARHRACKHRAAVAHDGHPIADAVELIELVADENHRHMLSLELPDDLEQQFDLALVER